MLDSQRESLLDLRDDGAILGSERAVYCLPENLILMLDKIYR